MFNITVPNFKNSALLIKTNNTSNIDNEQGKRAVEEEQEIIKQ